nr:FAD-dependent oxidoreductase [Actinopolymorpha pittospori]
MASGTLDPRRRRELEKEAAAARQFGLAATVSDRPDSTDLPFDVAAAVRFDDQFHLDPVRYLDGLAHELTRIGGIILEHTRATSVEERRDHTVAVSTSAGTVRADQVVVATLLPINLIGGYFARTRPSRSYGLAARLRTPAPTSMTISIDSPTRSTRPWLAAGPGGSSWSATVTRPVLSRTPWRSTRTSRTGRGRRSTSKPSTTAARPKTSSPPTRSPTSGRARAIAESW